MVEFDYVSWGGTGGEGADGMTVFLYDSAQANPMTGAHEGGGLGIAGAPAATWRSAWMNTATFPIPPTNAERPAGARGLRRSRWSSAVR